MKLVKVRNNNNRPVNNLDVMMKAVFGNRVPTEFLPDIEYKYGDVVFSIDSEGELYLYECNLRGIYSECIEPYFSKWILEDYIHSLIPKSVDTDPMLYDRKSFILDIGEPVETNKSIIYTIDLSGYEELLHIDRYDNLNINLIGPSKDMIIGEKEWAISDNNLVITVELNSLPEVPVKALVIFNKKHSEIAKFLKYVDLTGNIVDVDGELMVEIPRYEMLQYSSYEFELFINREYSPNYEQYVNTDTGIVYIKPVDISLSEDSVALIRVMYSICQEICIIKTSDNLIISDDKEAFRFPLTGMFINKYQWMNLRRNNSLYIPEKVLGTKEYAIIRNQLDYCNIGDTVHTDVFSLGVCNTGFVSECYPIFKKDRSITIPIVDYNKENDDFLLFHSGGVLIPSAKYYIEDSELVYYEHEFPFGDNDYVDFRVLSRDNTIRIQSRYLTINGTNRIDTGIDLSSCCFVLLFSMDGAYISNSKYTISGSEIIFNRSGDQLFNHIEGNRLELVFGTYTSTITRTIFEMVRIETTTDHQKKFDLDFKYNPNTDNVIVFRKDGMYIGERFYHIDNENPDGISRIVIDDGSGVPEGAFIDILLVRDLESYVSSGYIDEEDE